jgi:murein DD-endopeptidase MepM/ murein hydrolase activator NlpD
VLTRKTLAGSALLIFVAVLSGCAGGPRIISAFGDLRGPEGFPRVDGPHAGVDIAGSVGEPVLAGA